MTSWYDLEDERTLDEVLREAYGEGPDVPPYDPEPDEAEQ